MCNSHFTIQGCDQGAELVRQLLMQPSQAGYLVEIGVEGYDLRLGFHGHGGDGSAIRERQRPIESSVLDYGRVQESLIDEDYLTLIREVIV